jgi:hypothetical protein
MEEIVKTILAVALVASQTTYYEAKTTTFGCTSIDAVSQLQKVRANGKAFQAALTEQQIYGQCVAILKGTLVQGAVETADKAILRVNEEIDPPGYEAPLEDFETKAINGKGKRLLSHGACACVVIHAASFTQEYVGRNGHDPCDRVACVSSSKRYAQLLRCTPTNR